MTTSFGTTAGVIDEAVHAARRAATSVRRGADRLVDVKDDAAYRVRRAPIATVATVASVAFFGGAVLGWVSGRFVERRQDRALMWK